jgi:plastocyanin
MNWTNLSRTISGLLAPTLLLGCAVNEPAPQEPAVRQVVVDGVDYAFGMAEAMEAGPTEIRFENKGEVDHEMVLVRLKVGATLADVSGAMESGGDPREFMDGIAGILIAGPGESALGTLNVTFEEGRTYVMICNFTDTPDAPPHLALGMVQSFTVGEGAGAQ